MILFIDDEPRYMEIYLEALDLSFDKRSLDLLVSVLPDAVPRTLEPSAIVYTNEIGTAYALLTAYGDVLELIILDISMPLRDFSPQHGLRTGEVFFNKLRETHKTLPVLVLTNVFNKDLVKRFQAEPYCALHHKENLLPHQLAEEVQEMLLANKYVPGL